MENFIELNKCQLHPNKQKKWERKLEKLVEYDDKLGVYMKEPSLDELKQFISSLIDETEKQAQSEMREELIKWAKKKNRYCGCNKRCDCGEHNQVLDDLISYLNKTI